MSLKIVQHNLGASATACIRIQTIDLIKQDKHIHKDTKQSISKAIDDALILQAKYM